MVAGEIDRKDLKAWLGAMRTSDERDPFEWYHLGLMSKGKLLDYIVEDIISYLEQKGDNNHAT